MRSVILGKKDKNNCFETNPSNNGSFLAKPNAERNTSSSVQFSSVYYLSSNTGTSLKN